MIRVAPTLLLAMLAFGEDSVAIWGNYYKERSTRVVEPTIELAKDLPHNAAVKLGYQVDVVTSASGAFTPEDAAFTEQRHEIRASGHLRWGRFRPGLRFRASYEPDYLSIGPGVELTLGLRGGNTVLRATVERLEDKVASRSNPDFHERLSTTLLGVGWVETFRPELLGGVSIEVQALRGYQENPYRVEIHPRQRNRYVVSPFVAYHWATTHTSTRVGYRFYTDDWQLIAHTVDLEISQRVSANWEIVPRFRWHRQGNVYFVTPSADGFLTSDPKLSAFDAQLYGLGARIALAGLRRTALSGLARSRIEPSYAYLDQENSYGPAHIAQLGWFWPL